MQLIRTENWYRTPNGDPRGYIESAVLRELWFHTGTACNLACPFCLEGSKLLHWRRTLCSKTVSSDS